MTTQTTTKEAIAVPDESRKESQKIASGPEPSCSNDRIDNAKLSIIVPHLNQPEHLARCLQGLTEQTAGIDGIEIIVVDNGSKELPVSICAAFPNTLLEFEPTPGPGPARNRGIAVATYPLLAFIDADCVPHPNWVATLIEKLDGNPQIEAIGGDVRIGVVKKDDLTSLEAYESVFAYRQEYYIKTLKFSGTGNLAVRRTAIAKVGPFAGIDVAEDRDWGKRAHAKGISIEYVQEMIVYHPARTSFGELVRKWDRHVSHDFEEKALGVRGSLKWIGLTFAVFGSGFIDVWRIIASDRISRPSERFLAAVVLIKIRAYRSWKMATMLVSRRQRASRTWNRE